MYKLQKYAKDPLIIGFSLAILFVVGFVFDAKQLVSLVGHLAWPASIIIVAAYFKEPLRLWLDKANKIALKVPGGTEILLEAEEAQGILQEVLDGIETLVKEMNDKEKLLIVKLVEGSEGSSVKELFPDFLRSSGAQKNEAHQALRLCRRKHLIRPMEGGRWKEYKRIELTPFGRLIYKIKGKEINHVAKKQS